MYYRDRYGYGGGYRPSRGYGSQSSVEPAVSIVVFLLGPMPHGLSTVVRPDTHDEVKVAFWPPGYTGQVPLLVAVKDGRAYLRPLPLVERPSHNAWRPFADQRAVAGLPDLKFVTARRPDLPEQPAFELRAVAETSTTKVHLATSDGFQPQLVYHL